MPGPRKFDRDDLVPKICARLATGEPLEPILREMGLQKRTVNYWREHEEDIAKQFDEARDAGYDAIAYRLRATARGKSVNQGGDSTGDTQRDKLIIETDLKLLAKWDPRRYGDKVQQEITGKDGSELKFMLYVPEKQ